MYQLAKPKSYKKVRRVGRGGKRGTYSGRGIKGQKARAGARIRPAFRDFMKKIPKLRGTHSTYENLRGSRSLPISIQTISLSTIEKYYKKGETVSPRTLYERKLIRRIKGRIPSVKILGGGPFSKNVVVEGCAISKSVKSQLEKAGAKIK